MITMLTHTPGLPPCTCTDDADLDRLRALVAARVPQMAASRHLWGGAPLPTRFVVAGVRAETVALVRAEYAAAFPWLRLPDLEVA